METDFKALTTVPLTLCAAVFFWSGCSASTRVGPERFGTPEQAVERLGEVIADRNRSDAERIFGPGGDFLLHSGDETLDKQRARQFKRAFNARRVLSKKNDNTYVLHIGQNRWPFPVPIVKDTNDWIFDAAAGRAEILARRVGENELRAMAVCRSVAQAQWLYATKDHNGDGIKEYAAKIVSTPGKRDGLYWPASDQEERSPLSILMAQAAEEGYSVSPTGEPRPYHGYLFKVFAKRPQKGRPHGSYWLVAHPVVPGESGVMLFASNERGWIYEKPPQEEALKTLSAASAFEIDSSWTRVE
jgi:hypothetical protein